MNFVGTIKRRQQLISRIIVFFGLTVFFIPFIFDIIKVTNRMSFSLNFFSFPVFMLVLAVLFGIFNRKIILKFRFRSNNIESLIFAVISLLSFVGYYFVKFTVRQTIMNFHFVLGASTVLYFAGIAFLALAVFGRKFFDEMYDSLMIFAVITGAFYMTTQFLWDVWRYLASFVATVVYHLILLFSSDAFLKITTNDPTIGIGNFRVTVGSACSGIESLSLFIALFALLSVYEYDRLDWGRASIVLVIGLVGTFLMNILRVILIVVIGTFNPEFAVGLFHSQAGWVLFAGFMLVLMYFAYGWMLKKSVSKKS